MAGTLLVSRLTCDRPGPLLAGLLADMHIGADPASTFEGGYNPASNSAAAVGSAQQFDPGIVIFLGDLARSSGEDGDYTHWQRLFAPLTAARPAVLLPGNHDRRDRMLAHFASDGPQEVERVLAVVETPGVRLIALDSLYRTDVVPGLLGEAQRAWLERYLDEHDQRPTIVLVHHHLGDDDKALLDGDRLLRILRVRSQVKAVVTAHRHVYRHQTIDGLHLVAAPALGMPFADEEPLGWLEASFDETGAVLGFRGIDGGERSRRRIDWRA